MEALGEAGPQLYVGGAAGLLGDVRADELDSYQRLLEVLETRAAALELLSETLDPRRPLVRVGPELENPALRDAAFVGAGYGLAEPEPRRRRAARARCGWTTTRRSAPCARLPTSCRGSSRRSTRSRNRPELHFAGAWRRPNATTTSCSASRGRHGADIKRAFRRKARELHPDVSRSSDAQERFREVAEAYEVLSNAETRRLYDRYGHAGLRRGGFHAVELRHGQPVRPVRRVLRRRPVRRRRGGVARARRRSRGRRRGRPPAGGDRRHHRGRDRGRRHVRGVRRRRRRAGDTAGRVP